MESSSLRGALLPGEVSNLVLHLVSEVVEGGRARSWEEISRLLEYTLRYKRTSLAILLFKIWKPVDLAICLLHGSIERRRTDQLDESQ
jgi:hypothetical protein